MEVLEESRSAGIEEQSGGLNRGGFYERGFADSLRAVKECEPEATLELPALPALQQPVPQSEKSGDHQVVSIAKQILQEVRAEQFAALASALRRLACERARVVPSSKPAPLQPVTAPPTELAAPTEPASISSGAPMHAQSFRVPQPPRPQRLRDIVVDLAARLAELETDAPTAQLGPASPRAQPDPGFAVAAASSAKRPSFVLDMSRVASIRDQSLPGVRTGSDEEDEPAINIETPIESETAVVPPPEAQVPDSQAFPPGKPKSVSAKPRVPHFTVDLTRVARLQEESREVESLLGAIFVDEAPADTARPASASPSSGAEGRGIAGLDATHSRFATLILSRDAWSREALERHATEYDLMLDGALELINDCAYDVFGETLTEEGESIEVNVAVVTRMKAGALVDGIKEGQEARHA